MTGSVLNKKKIKEPYVLTEDKSYKFIPLHLANSGTILQRIIRRRKDVVTSCKILLCLMQQILMGALRRGIWQIVDKFLVNAGFICDKFLEYML